MQLMISMKVKTTNIYWLFIFLLVIAGCSENYTPKPRGYFRIDLPSPTYKHFSSAECPYEFDINKEAFIIPHNNNAEPCWINLLYPNYKATIHFSYKKVEDNLTEMMEDSRSLVYKHTVKASDIQEHLILHDSTNVYGLVYELEGEAASLVQFYLTDSVNHFIRGAMYFNVKPNYDSLSPVTTYIKQDIKYLVNSFRWK